jgi:hypothetical protein
MQNWQANILNETTPRHHAFEEETKLLKEDFSRLFEKSKEMHQ